MVYREVDMWEILSVLERIGRGESKAAVARATGHDRKTVRSYVEEARQLGWPGTAEPTEKLARRAFRKLHPQREAPGESEEILLAHAEQIRKWLTPDLGAKRGLRLTKIHQLLVRRGVEVPYSSLHRFAVKHCGFSDRRRVTVRVADSEPGEAAELDFGRLGFIPDPAAGHRRTVWALIITLLHSRHQYVHVSHSQKVQDVIAGLEDAWYFFGGVVRRLVIDNLKPAVKKADRYDPVFQKTFDEYARYRAFVSDACVSGHATGKPRVERNVPYVRDNFFRGEEWRDLELKPSSGASSSPACASMAPRASALWRSSRMRSVPRSCRSFANATTRLAGSSAAFTPIITSWSTRPSTLSRRSTSGRRSGCAPTASSCASITTANSSRRTETASRRQAHRSRRLPHGADSLHHARSRPLHRSGQKPRRQTRRVHGAPARRSHPWSRLRQAQKLLRLGGKYGWSRLEGACQRALAFDVINVNRVETILKQDLEQLDVFSAQERSAQVVPIESRFLRRAESFSHNPNTEGGK